MSDNSAIEWTDASWQVTHGCSKIAPGCRNCYAIRDVHRMAGNPNPKISEPRKGLTKHHERKSTTGVVEDYWVDWTGEVRTAPENLSIPLRRKKPYGKADAATNRPDSLVFVNSNSDLFHESVPFEFIAAVFGVMAACPQHTFQVLTKRPERMREFFAWARNWKWYPEDGCDAEARRRGAFEAHSGNVLARSRARWPIKNVWLGTSISTQADADKNIPALLQCPAAVRFVSAEPLLEDVDFGMLVRPMSSDSKPLWPCAEPMLHGLDWIIVGGESGPGARPCDVAWIRSIVQQCQAASVPVFVKQLGSKPEGRYFVDGRHEPHPWNPANGKWSNPDEWPIDLRVRQFPALSQAEGPEAAHV